LRIQIYYFLSPPDGASIDDDIQDDLRGSLDVQARLLYGLIHARWIITARGLTKMVWFKKLTAGFILLNLSLSA
jgi:hypothetical protein